MLIYALDVAQPRESVMKKNSPKKLALNKDTLCGLTRELQGRDLKEVAGNGFTFLEGCTNRVSCNC
jgi:hypothetical protein